MLPYLHSIIFYFLNQGNVNGKNGLKWKELIDYNGISIPFKKKCKRAKKSLKMGCLNYL